jgi:uncharacterized protein
VRSRLYEGWLQHRRLQPRPHHFRYRLFMPYLCLEELPQLFQQSRLWSAGRWAPARFAREDFLGDAGLPLDEAVRQRVAEDTGERPQGPIYLLANLRYFGFNMNPIACYFCFNRDESALDYLVAEVTNTPWNERHSYVLPGPGRRRWLRCEFDKALHVSPFNPMGMRYQWRSSTPGDSLRLHLATTVDSERVFDACLSLQASPWDAPNLRRVLWQYPMMTGQVALGIYWQALRLFGKGLRFHPHPHSTSTGDHHEQHQCQPDSLAAPPAPTVVQRPTGPQAVVAGAGADRLRAPGDPRWR